MCSGWLENYWFARLDSLVGVAAAPFPRHACEVIKQYGVVVLPNTSASNNMSPKCQKEKKRKG
jgi:hypothetical protein